MGMTDSMPAAGDTEMSVVFPALQCPAEETEKLGLDGEKGEGRHFRCVWGNSMCKGLGGMRQHREGASVIRALVAGAGVCQGTRLLSLACDGEREG